MSPHLARRRILRFLKVAVLMSALWMPATRVPLHAQDAATGAIVGTVFDATGAVIARADVRVTALATHVTRSIQSNAQGVFRASLLPPGKYAVLVHAVGFEDSSITTVPVVVSETASLSLQLEAGHVAVNVVVTQGQVESSALGRVTDEQAIQELPLANRNFTQLLALSPGVESSLADATALGRNNQNVSANGSGTTFNNFLFNGVDANNLSENSASGYISEVGLAAPAPDTIQEFKAQTGGYDASYGRGAGANVDLISRSGSNQIHGSLWEFLRNDALNANAYFAKRNGQPRPVLKQNQFGFTLGGPLRRDRTFLFASYQGTTQRNGDSSLSLVTTSLPQLTGDRSAAALGAQFCPDTRPGNTGYQTVGGGTQVACDGSNINPVALKLLNFKFANGEFAIPSPQTNLDSTAPDELPIGQSTFSIPAQFREDQYGVNLDQTITAGNQLSGRFFYSHAPTAEPFSPFGNNVPGWGTTELDQNTMFVLADTQAISSSLVNVARFGFMRFDGDAVIVQPISAADLGMATPGPLPEIPGMVVNGAFDIGTAGEPFYWQNTNTFIWQDTVSYTHGRHTLRVGPEIKRHELDVNVPFSLDGFITFSSFPDFLIGQSAAQNGSPFSNVSSSSATSGIVRKDERYFDAAGFVQDDFKFTPWLTLNAGLRWEFFGPPSDVSGRLPTFDPSVASPTAPDSGTLSGFILPANYTGPLPLGAVRSNHNGLWANRYEDISPRFGFAARLPGTRASSLRGGYGIYYDRVSGSLAETTVAQPPFSFQQSLAGAQNGGATLQDPYSPALPPDSAFPIFLPRVPDGGLSVAAISPKILDPYTQQYDLNLQFELAHDYLWEIGYVGSKTTHLVGCLEFNQSLLASPEHPANGATKNSVANVVQRVRFEGIATGSYTCQSTFDSRYDSLQTSMTKRMSHGLQFLGSYTWSKNLDSISGSGGLTNFELGFITNDQFNQRQARGLSDVDRAHRGVLSLVYAPPAVTEGPRIARIALSDWRMATVAVAQSGSPITVNDSFAGSVYGNISVFNRAQCSGINPATSGSIKERASASGRYLNLAAFTDPPLAPNGVTIGDGSIGTQPTDFGNCGVGILRGPIQRNIDYSLERAFKVRERGVFTFRGEAFNLTNTPSFANPDSGLRSGDSFGRIGGTVSNPRIVQFALKLAL